jgi:hypothetical protein
MFSTSCDVKLTYYPNLHGVGIKQFEIKRLKEMHFMYYMTANLH